jgi:hypothetical protein
MKKSSDIIGNRTRDLPVCSAVPQPLRHRVPAGSLLDTYINRRTSLVYLEFGCYVDTYPCCGTIKKVTLTVPWGHIDLIKKTE